MGLPEIVTAAHMTPTVPPSEWCEERRQAKAVDESLDEARLHAGRVEVISSGRLSMVMQLLEGRFRSVIR